MAKKRLGPQVHNRLDAKQEEKVVKLLRETDMTFTAISQRMSVSSAVISRINEQFKVRSM